MNTVMWSKFKEYIITKNSHGKNELLSKMVSIEIQHSNEQLRISALAVRENADNYIKAYKERLKTAEEVISTLGEENRVLQGEVDRMNAMVK